MNLGWVVVCWNQASGCPDVEFDELFSNADHAQEVATEATRLSRENNRREQFTVAEVVGEPPDGGAA